MYIFCTKDEKGILAELVGESMLRVHRNKSGRHPVLLTVTGKDFDVLTECALCQEPHRIECVDGKITQEGLLLKEKINDKEEDEDGKEENDEKDGDEGGEGSGGAGSNVDPKPGDDESDKE